MFRHVSIATLLGSLPLADALDLPNLPPCRRRGPVVSEVRHHAQSLNLGSQSQNARWYLEAALAANFEKPPAPFNRARFNRHFHRDGPLGREAC